MKRISSVCALALIVGACGGDGTNMYTTSLDANDAATTIAPDTDTGIGITSKGIPFLIANDFKNFLHNPVNKTIGPVKSGHSDASVWRKQTIVFTKINSSGFVKSTQIRTRKNHLMSVASTVENYLLHQDFN